MINRSAIVIRQSKPCIDWINKIYPEETPTEDSTEHNVYLIPQCDEEAQAWEWLAQGYDDIFKNELMEWTTNEKNWPQPRTFDLFKEWFKIEIHLSVNDLCTDNITPAH